MKKIVKVMGIIAIVGIMIVLLTNISPLTIYSKKETKTDIYYTYEYFDENGNKWRDTYLGRFKEQQPLFTEDNIDTLREIKHTDTIIHTTTYKLKGFKIIKEARG